MLLLMSFCVVNLFFFFKLKTAYEMRISDWSSDVCSSDLLALGGDRGLALALPLGAWHRAGGGGDLRQESAFLRTSLRRLVHPLARGGIDGLARRGVAHAAMAAVEEAEEQDRVGHIAHGSGAAPQRPRPEARAGARAGAGDTPS